MRRLLAPASCLTSLALLLAAANASAQPPPPPPGPPPAQVTEETTSEAIGPSIPLIMSGVVVFGLAYLPAVAVGSASGLDADRTLFVPLAGPWIDLVQRPGCSGAGSACNGETTNKVLLVTDGVFQAIGAVTTLSGFLTPAHRSTTVRTASEGLTWHLSPASFGKESYGMQMAGSF